MGPMSPGGSPLADSLGQFQSLYDRHRFLDLYALTSQYWDKTTDVNSLPVEALILGARLAARLGGPRLGRWLLREALRRDPSDPAVRYFAHGVNARRVSPLDELKDLIANPDLGGDDPELRASWSAWAAYLWAMLRDFDRAHDSLRLAHSLHPDDSWVLHLESGVYGLADRWPEALRSAERALEVDPGAQFALSSLGLALVNLGRVEESARRLSAEAESGQSFEIVLAACWHQCALAETLDGERQRDVLEHARRLAGRLAGLMPLADRETLNSVARTNLDIAGLADDYGGIERWSSEVHSPFHRQMLANLERNKAGTRVRLPFRRTIQKYETCLPSSLAAALSAGGIEISANEMAAAITFGGTTEWAAADWLRARGYDVRFFFATPDVAARLIRHRIPFVICWEGEEMGHAVAAVGLDERSGTLLVHDPQSFRSAEYLLTALDTLASPLGVKGMAVVKPEQAPALDALLPPESAVMEASQEYAKQMTLHGLSASRQVVVDLLGRFPSHPGTEFLEAAQALEEGHVGQALGKLKKLLRQYPGSPLVRVRFIHACHALGNTALSRQALKDIVEAGTIPGVEARQDWIYPPDLYVYEYADLLRLSTDTRDRAESLLLKLIRRQGTSAGAWHDLADLLTQKRDMPGALLSYRISAGLAESNEHYARAYADALAAEKQEEEAFRWLEARARRLGNAPYAVSPWLTWVSTLEDRGYPERALAACDEALARPGVSAELLSFAVPFFARMGDWSRAEIELGRLREAGLPHAFFEASTRLDQMRGDLESAVRDATAWIAELPRYIVARRALLDVLDAREGHEAAVRTSFQWMRENRDHEGFEEAYCAQLDRASAPPWKKYSVLLRGLRRDPEDAWAWHELTFTCLSEYQSADDRKRRRLEPRITRYLAECDRTSAGTVPTLRAHALWSEYHGDWAAAMARSLEAIALDPETIYSYWRAWECASRFKVEERKALWDRMEPMFIAASGRLAIAREVMGLIAERFGVAAVEKTVERWRAARPEDPDVLEAAADLLIEHGHGRSDAARAISLLEPAVLRYPYHSGLRFSLANAYRRAGRDPEAEAVLEEIARRHPRNPAAKIQLAWISSLKGDAQGAMGILDRAMVAEPQNSDLLDARVQILIDHGRYDEAIRDVEGGLGRWPSNAEWRRRAVDLLTQCGAADKAIRAARDGVEIAPRRAFLWFLLGRTLYGLRRYAEIGEIEGSLRRSLQLDSALYDAADLLAMLLTEQRQYDDASRIIVEIEPRLTDPSPACGRLAWIQRQRGQKKEAVADIAEVLESFPGYLWGWNALFDWLEEDAAWDQAKRSLRAIPPPLFTNTYFRQRRLTLLDKATSDEKQMDEEWVRLLRDFPEDVSLHVRRYDVLMRASRWEDAAAAIEAIERAEPDDPSVLACRCELLAHDRKPDAACEVALRVCFMPVEGYAWPAEKVWEVARREGFAGDLALRFRRRLRAGDRPTLSSFSRLAAYAMRDTTKVRSWPPISVWFPRGGARELMGLVEDLSAAPWDGSEYRAVIYSLLGDYGYSRLVTKLASRIDPAAVTAVNEWAQIGRAFLDSRQLSGGRRFLSAWRERPGVAMWMMTNYILSLSRRRRAHLEERYASARDALAGLPHDHCAKYLAHVQAEAAALLGHKEDFLETWAAYGRYFDGQIGAGEFFHGHDRHLLVDIPKLAESMTQDQRGRARRMIWKLRLGRAAALTVTRPTESRTRPPVMLQLIGLQMLVALTMMVFSQTDACREHGLGISLDRSSPPSLQLGTGESNPPPEAPPRWSPRRGAEAPDRQTRGLGGSFSLAMPNSDLVAGVTRSFSGDSSYGATGEVRNRGAKTFHFVMVRVEFRDSFGRVVGALSTDARRDEYVLPGGVISFSVRGRGKLTFASARASVVYSAEVKSP